MTLTPAYAVSRQPVSCRKSFRLWPAGIFASITIQFVLPDLPAIDKWTTTCMPDWVISCHYSTYNNSYCIEMYTILWKTGELSHWIFGVTVCKLREPRTLLHNAWSGYRWQTLRIQFPLQDLYLENLLLSNCPGVEFLVSLSILD